MFLAEQIRSNFYAYYLVGHISAPLSYSITLQFSVSLEVVPDRTASHMNEINKLNVSSIWRSQPFCYYGIRNWGFAPTCFHPPPLKGKKDENIEN